MKTKGHPPILSLPEIRAIALRAQGLAEEEAPFGLGKAAVLRAVEHLGYVQVDAVNVIQRAHHHVLWERIPDYSPDMLHELQNPDGKVFEYWNHAASYLPMRDFRFSLPLMRKHQDELHWCDESAELTKSMRRMMRLIRGKGALKISDVESEGTAKNWSATALGKIERRALHELWMRGDIMIRSRHGVEKVFDLPERVVPAGIDLKRPSAREAAEFHVRRALRALGVAAVSELHYLQDAGRAEAARAAVKELVKRGEAVEVRAEGLPHLPLYAWAEALEKREPLERQLVRFLSPFDNLTIQRKRLKWLFDFDYTIEIYVPAAKRKFGYFVLPILWGDRMIARMDAKAMRAERKLVIHRLVFEPGFRDWKTARPAFQEALERFTRFQGCDTWTVTRTEPERFRLG